MSQVLIDPQIQQLDFQSAEAINMLRGNIQLAGYQMKVVALTSAAPNEGKSYVSFHLARSLAGLSKRTVFVDCDIRNSSVKRTYKITEQTVGLSEYLCGLYSAEDIVYPTTSEHLDIIFAGRRAPNPSEILSGEMFGKLLQYLKERYDYVILDTPPVNLVVDATIISKQADTTVLVVKSFSTDRAAVMRMKKQLESAGVKILGVVMNLCDAGSSHYGKYGYGKYGQGKYAYGAKEYGYGTAIPASIDLKSR
ncbi:MAG: CpsD/CapB family tyrosine-protein kinase [Acetatifactor sp.]